ALTGEIVELQRDTPHEISSRHRIVIGIEPLLAHRRCGNVDACHRAADPHRVIDPLRQLAVREVWRFRRATMSNRESFRFEVWSEHPGRTLQRKNMMAANYRHIGDLENRLGRHYSRFSASGPAAPRAAQSLAPRKSRNGGSNRRSWVRLTISLAALLGISSGQSNPDRSLSGVADLHAQSQKICRERPRLFCQIDRSRK